MQELHSSLLDGSSSNRELTFSPLYEAIEEATKLSSRGEGGCSNNAHARKDAQEKFFSALFQKAGPEKATESLEDLAVMGKPLPTEEQYLDLSWWLAQKFVEQAFDVCHCHQLKLGLELDKQEKQAWIESKMVSKVSPMVTHLNILFGLDEHHFHACNINNVEQVCRPSSV